MAGTETDRLKRLDAFMGKLNKTYGSGFVGRASTQLRKHVPRIPTGIAAVDVATGGGFPVGRTTMIYGEKSGGKTTVLKKWIAEAQQICSNCLDYRTETMNEQTGEITFSCDCKDGYRQYVVAFMDAEGAYDPAWASKLGVNNDELLYAAPETAEQAIDIVDAWLRTGDLDAVCVDSLAMLTPSVEIEESVEKQQQGLQARLLNKACRKWNGALNTAGREFKRRPTLILINQIRQKIGVMFGDPTVKPGGMGQEFITSIELKLWSGKVEIDKESNKPLWAVKRFKCDKNKLSPPFQSGEFSLVMSDYEGRKLGDLMEEDWIFDEMGRLGLLKYEKEGGNIVLIGEERLNGKGQVIRYWLKNPTVFEEAKQLLLEVSLRS